jgi:hypothetical protein
MKNKVQDVASNRYAQVVTFLVTMLGLSTAPAYAVTDPNDPLQGGGDAIFTQLTSYLTTSLTAKVFALAVVSIAIGLVLKWVRKAVHA